MNTEALRLFAIERHGAQLYGNRAYSEHLDEVFAVVRRHALGVAYERAAFGHDLLDDTLTTTDELVVKFGVVEADLIYSVSGHGHNRASRRDNTLARLTRHPAGIDLKMADRYANLSNSLKDGNRALVKMYLGEREHFAPLFARGSAALRAELALRYGEAERMLGRSTTIAATP